jgi:hypothetical protein
MGFYDSFLALPGLDTSMWPLDENTQAFQTLSYGDKLRVSRYLTRGEAPDDHRWQRLQLS